MANWFIASRQFLAVRPQSAVMLRRASQSSLLATSSVGKCPRDLMILRSCALMLSMALIQRKPARVVMHTDRGSQYGSREHRALLDEHGLIAGMSAKGDCYGKAAMESWSHNLKLEAMHVERFHARSQAKVHVFEYIEVDYNRNWLHSTLGYLSSEQFERAHAAWASVRNSGQDHGSCLRISWTLG
jgi:transposase InsO family protein